MSTKPEEDLFALAIGNALPLTASAKIVTPAKRPRPQRLHASRERQIANLPQPSTSESPLQEPSPWRLLRPGISRERLRKLGQTPVDIVIDLHGMHRDRALEELQRALNALLIHHGRIAEVIHGRGLHSGGAPVLRQTLYDWLHHGALHHHILAAIPKPGSGGGASLVLLRRQR